MAKAENLRVAVVITITIAGSFAFAKLPAYSFHALPTVVAKADATSQTGKPVVGLQAQATAIGSVPYGGEIRGCPVDGGCGDLPMGRMMNVGRTFVGFAATSAWNCINDTVNFFAPSTKISPSTKN